MALDRQIARLSKILVDSEGITFDEAQARLRALTLEIVVGADAASPAAHAAALTAVSVGSRTFVGGVRIVGAVDQPLKSALPLTARTLGEGGLEVGASSFKGEPSHRIFIGTTPDSDEGVGVSAQWHGWRAAAVEPGQAVWDEGQNPLVGIAAGAITVGVAFQKARGRTPDLPLAVDLWPTGGSETPPDFAEVFLPGALWLIGLGNLGQAYLWALASLPYANPAAVHLVLQDRDKVTEENWATSVLVRSETYGDLKTKVAEAWATAKGFDVRRVDRRLLANDRLEEDDPRMALSGVDKIEARKLMAHTGFHCILDAGLGRTAGNFDRYRVTVFDAGHSIEQHFEGQSDAAHAAPIPDKKAYKQLEAEVGACGTAEVAGASVAAPYVSAIAAAVAVSRLIAIASGCPCETNEVRRVSEANPKATNTAAFDARGIRHAGRPAF